VHAGSYTGTVDTRLSARGMLVSPGFINTHVHTTGNGGDYMLHDMVKKPIAPRLPEFLLPPQRQDGAHPGGRAACATYVSCTPQARFDDIIDVGGQRGDWEGYVVS